MAAAKGSRVRPQEFLFPLQIAALQGRYGVDEGGARRLEVQLSSKAILSVESFPHAKGWDALATMRREGREVAAGGHAAHADRFLAEAAALDLLATCCEIPGLPTQLRQALASEYRVIAGPSAST